jgi:capsular exopolysaccharide synthesis family protein
MPKLSTNSGIMIQNPDSPISEAFRSLRFNLESIVDREMKTITITSAGKGEGKTTTALNLAVASAQIGKKVLLIDADLRNPSIHLSFGVDNTSGLTSFLTGQRSAKEIIRETHVDNLSIIMSGPILPNPAELLASKAMSSLLTELKRDYDMIIMDAPSILPLTDAKIIAAKCDGVLLVVGYGKLKQNVAKRVKEELVRTKAKLIGVVLNRMNNQDAEAYFQQ